MVESKQVIWSPFIKDYFIDPHKYYSECRIHNPIQYDRYGNLMLFSYPEVAFILKSKDCEVSDLSEFFREKEEVIFKNSGQCPFLAQSTNKWLMYLNGNLHRRLRVGLGKVLFRYNFDELIEKAVVETNTAFEGKKDFDLVDYGKFFIFRILDRFIGIENFESFEKVTEYSNLLARSQDLFVTKKEYLRINEYLVWGKKMFENSEFRKLLEQELEDVDLSDNDIYSLLAMTLMAFFETSKDNFSLTLLEILRDRSLFSFIERADKKNIRLLSEEMLRYNSPLQFTVRLNKKEITIRDTTIPANTKMILCIASANRDESVFEKGNEILPDRKNNPHFSFGSGEHVCLGSLIARKEMEIGLKGMAAFLARYQLIPESVEYGNQIFMRTLESAKIEMPA